MAGKLCNTCVACVCLFTNVINLEMYIRLVVINSMFKESVLWVFKNVNSLLSVVILNIFGYVLA